MIKIQKGLVVREPWIDLLLSGQKTWEMRSQSVGYRGWIALIRKGSGRVSGIARLADVGGALTPEQMVATFEKHRIPVPMIWSGKVAKWNIPWKLADLRPLREPVPYVHPNGAITLFSLDPAVAASILEQLGEPEPVSSRATGTLSERHPPSPRPTPINGQLPRHSAASPGLGIFLGESEITEGNIKNHHFYLRPFLHRFPDDLIDGRSLSPPVVATVEAPKMRSTTTDICPRHRFFRDRSWTREFLQDAETGDKVQVHQVEPYRYRVELRKQRGV